MSSQTFTSYHTEPPAALLNIGGQEFSDVPMWRLLQLQYSVIAAPLVAEGVIIPAVLQGHAFSSYSAVNNVTIER